MDKFLAWWTADHIQAVKKAVVMMAGVLAYVLPPHTVGSQVAVLVAAGGISDSTAASVWKVLQGKAADKNG